MKSRVLCFLPLLALGCYSGPAIVPKEVAFTPTNGMTEGGSDDGKVKIGIPSGWRQGVDRAMSGFDSGMLGQGDGSTPQGEAGAALEQLSKEIDKMGDEAEKEQLEKLKAKGIIVHVINGSKPIIGEQRTKFIVKRESDSANWTWEMAEKFEKKQFLHNQTPKTVQLPIGEARRFEETRQLVDGANFTQISYIVISGKDLYSLRFITEEAPEAVKSIDKQVAESLRIKA